MFVNSFKTLGESSLMGMGFPTEWHPENYTKVIREGDFFRGLLNTILVVVGVIPAGIFMASLAGWIFARSKLKILQVLYYISISGILIPPALITSIFLLKALNIYSTRPGLIFFYIGTEMSFYIFFVTGFVKTIPRELEDSARIDGASNIRVFLSLIFPLLRPISITVGVLSLMFIWNDFIYPFYFLTTTKQFTMVLGLFSFYSSYYRLINWNLIFAYLIIVTLPLLVFFFFAQKQVLKGLTAGAVKH